MLLRRTLFDEDYSDEVWLRKLVANGFSEHDVEYIMSVVDDRGWIEEVLGGHPSSAFGWDLVSNIYRNTWFAQDYVNSVVATKLGCMAGTSPADLVYALSFFRVLFRFYDALVSKGLVSSLSRHSHAPSLELCDVDYCDDTVIPVFWCWDPGRQSSGCC